MPPARYRMIAGRLPTAQPCVPVIRAVRVNDSPATSSVTVYSPGGIHASSG